MSKIKTSENVYHSHAPPDYKCPYCLFLKHRRKRIVDRGNLLVEDDVIFESRLSIAVMAVKWWPRNPGHVLIIPKRHQENIYTITNESLADIAVMSKRIAMAQKLAFHCDGTSTRQQNEPAGDQNIWHFHHHVIPRWIDDNFCKLQGDLVSAEVRRPFAQILRDALVDD